MSNAAHRRGSETPSREEFQHSLRLLDVITSWHLWGGALMMLLLPGTIILVSFPSVLAQLGLSPELPASLVVRGLLGLLWVMSVVTLYQQRRRLKLLRKGLIEQTDAATKNRVRGEQFYGLSILDPLTGLYNRRFGETRLEEEITRAQESDDPLLLLAVDFDRFKEVNDRYGHAAGDLALQEFSRRLQRAIRACDVPIRVGGDEFLVILPQCLPDKIDAILSRMDSIAFPLGGEQIPVFFSHGMAQYQVNDTPETMIKRADERLYAEKVKRKSAARVDQDHETEALISANTSEHSSAEPLGCQPVSSIHVRRSGRIPKEIAISLIGIDLGGKVFSEQTNTVDLSRHGAGIVSRHKLDLEQVMILRCLDTNKEAEVRVVRLIESHARRHTYGLAFVNPDINFWGLEFPPLIESEKEASHPLFECNVCKARETLDNRDLESDGYEIDKTVVRSCNRCGSVTTWKRLLDDEAGSSVAEKPQMLARFPSPAP